MLAGALRPEHERNAQQQHHLGEAYEFSDAQALRPKKGQRSLGRQKRRRCERIESASEQTRLFFCHVFSLPGGRGIARLLDPWRLEIAKVGFRS
jgi:hypothetical protein